VPPKLSWLRFSFKLCLLVYKAIHGLAPCYLNELCIPVLTVPNLAALRSAASGDLVVPRTSTTRQTGILCGWSGRLEQSTTAHSFCTYIINVQKHAQDASFLTFLLHWLTVSRVRAANIVRRRCSDSSHVTAPYKLSFYNCYYYRPHSSGMYILDTYFKRSQWFAF